MGTVTNLRDPVDVITDYLDERLAMSTSAPDGDGKGTIDVFFEGDTYPSGTIERKSDSGVRLRFRVSTDLIAAIRKAAPALTDPIADDSLIKRGILACINSLLRDEPELYFGAYED